MKRRVPGARLSLNRGLTALALAWAAATTSVHAQAPTTDVAQAAAAALAGKGTAEGRKFANAIAAAFKREQTSAIQKCAGEIERPDLSTFDLLLRVDPAGVVREALTQPTTPLARCVAGAVVGWKGVSPPRGQEWVSIELVLKPRR